MRIVRRGRLAAVSAAALVAVAVPAAAGPGHRDASNVIAVRVAPDGGSLVDVRLPGGGAVTVPVGRLPAGFDPARLHISARRVPDPPAAGHATNRAVAASATAKQAAPIGQAAQFPPTAPDRPGTVVTIAGGNCDGYPARAATISPTRLSYGRDGSVVWVDDDSELSPTSSSTTGVTTGVVFSDNGRHLRGSLLIRTLDAAGRVHTLGPVLPDEYGRELRQDFWTRSMTQVVADGSGGAYYQKNADFSDQSPLHDGPGRTGIWRLRADGRRELVVGNGPFDSDWGHSLSQTVHDDEPVRGASLAFVTSFTLDPAGNVFFVESPTPPVGDNAHGLRIRFANLGHATVTFYRGTPWQVAVAPGRVESIAAMNQPQVQTGSGDITTRGLQPNRGDGGPAAAAEFEHVPSIAYRSGVLYAADHTWRGDGRSANVEIRAINLGLEPGSTAVSSRTVNGLPILNGNIDAVAGSQAGTGGYTGDGIPARGAAFNVENTQLYGDFAVDAAGRIVIADTLNHRIRMVDESGIVHTIAGTGEAGDDGDHRIATSSRVWGPTGIAVDPRGEPVFADYFNARLRRVSAAGTLDDVVGRGPTPCGEGQLATGAGVYGGAYFGQPHAVVTDSKGRIYVGDSSYNQIRRISRDGHIDLVIGRATRCAISDLSRDPACPPEGPQDGDGGPYATAGLADPRSLLVDSYDNLYIGDVDRVRYVNLSSHPVSVHGQTVAPGTIVTIHRFTDRLVSVSLDAPFAGRVTFTERQGIGDLALDGRGNLFVADPVLALVYRIGCTADVATIAGSGHGDGTDHWAGDGGSARSAPVIPVGLTYDRTRNVLLILDQRGWYTRVRAVNLGAHSAVDFGQQITPGVIETVAGAGGPGASVLWGDSSGDGGPAFDASLEGSSTLALMPSGRLYVADGIYNSVRVISPNGRIDSIAGRWPNTSPYDPSSAPSGYGGDGGPALQAWFGLLPHYAPDQASIAVGPQGSLVVVDTHRGRVRLIRDVDRAPARPVSKQAIVAAANRDQPRFTPAVELDADRTAALAIPDLTVNAATYVTAAEGEGHGCHAWSIVRRPGSGPAVSYLGQPGPAAVGAAGVAAGGSRCAVAAGTAAVVATPIRAFGDPSVEGRDLAVLLATSESGGTWQSSVTGATDRIGGRHLSAAAVAHTAAGTVVAFGAANGDLVVSRAPDAGSFSTIARVPGPVVDVGRMTGTPHGGLVLPVVVSRPRGLTVAVLRSQDGTHWSTSDVATVPAAVSTPAAAVDTSGTVYVTWSDTRHVVAMLAPGGRQWRPLELPQPQVAILPTVVAGASGQAAFLYYGTSTSGGGDALSNPRASWRLYSAVLRDAVAQPATVELRRAQAGEVMHGPICVSTDCTLGPHPGAPAAGLDSHGTLLAAFSSVLPGTSPGVFFAASCEPVFAEPGACSGGVRPAVPAAGGLPADVPSVDIPGLAACSPLPPPFPQEAPPAPQPGPVGAPPAAQPVVGAAPLVIAPLPPPAAPGPMAQAQPQAQSQAQAQSELQSASQGQGGMVGAAAPRENEQAEVATQGASGGLDTSLAFLLAAGLVMSVGYSACAAQQRRTAVARGRGRA